MAHSIPSDQVSCHECPHWNNSKWLHLSEDELEMLNLAKICKVYDPGDTIYFDGDRTYVDDSWYSDLALASRFFSQEFGPVALIGPSLQSVVDRDAGDSSGGAGPQRPARI